MVPSSGDLGSSLVQDWWKVLVHSSITYFSVQDLLHGKGAGWGSGGLGWLVASDWTRA